MKQAALFPVTEENFSQCWDHMDRLRRKARRMCAVAKVGGFFANLYFLFALLLIANGLIFAHFLGSYHRFLDSLPLFPELWEKISSLILRPGDSLAVQALKLLSAAYLSAIALFAVLALVTALLYHPRRKGAPEGSFASRTASLAKAAQEAWSKSYKTRLSTSLASTLLVIIAAFVLFFAYTIHLQDANAAQALLSIFPTHDFSTNAMIYVLAAYFVCHIFSTVLLLLSRFIYRWQFPYDLMVQAEAAALLAREAPGDLSQENLALWRTERAEVLRTEALALEKEAAYQKARTMLHDAALLGDGPAMEHYARHCILSHLHESARYWLKQAIASGSATGEAVRMLRRLALKLNHRVQYLRPDAAPLTKKQILLQRCKTMFTVLWRILIALVMLAIVAVLVVLFQNDLDLSILTDFPGALSRLFR